MAEPKIDTAWFQGLIKDKGYSQRGFARLIEMDHAALSLMLNGKRKMSVGEAGMLAQFLDQPAAEVMRRAGVEVRAGEHETTDEPVTDLDHARYDRDGWMESALRAQGVVVQLQAEIAQLRSRLLDAEQGGEAMRERCARWHEDRAEEFDCEARDRTLPDGSWAGRDAMWARADAQAHREHAAAIRALNPNQEAGDHEPR